MMLLDSIVCPIRVPIERIANSLFGRLFYFYLCFYRKILSSSPKRKAPRQVPFAVVSSPFRDGSDKRHQWYFWGHVMLLGSGPN